MNADLRLHNEWASRPNDERFSTLAAMTVVTEARDAVSTEVDLVDPRVSVNGDTLLMTDARFDGRKAFNYHSFAQLAEIVGLPPRIMRRLPTANVSADINSLLENTGPLVAYNTNGIIRGITSTRYGRINDREVLKWLTEVTDNETNGWKRPPAYTDEQHPSGYYLSDHDMLVGMVNESVQVANGDGGIIMLVSNSEVGNNRALNIMMGAYIYVCGNHMIWGLREMFNGRVVHLGDKASWKFQQIKMELGKNATAAAALMDDVIQKAKQTFVAPDEEGVINWLTTKPRLYSQKESREFNSFNVERGSDPTNLYNIWDAASTISHVGQQDKRLSEDIKAGKLLAYAV